MARRIRRIRRPPVQRRTAVADYLVRRADEEKRRHPEKSYAEIGRELGIEQKDPARLIRKLRTGETSGRQVVPGIIGRLPRAQREPEHFVVAYQWWYTALPDVKYWARVNIKVTATRADVFRLRDDPRVQAAVERDLARKTAMNQRQRLGSVPSPDRGTYDFDIDSVHIENVARAPQLVIESKISA